jgi:hypothetical protein
MYACMYVCNYVCIYFVGYLGVALRGLSLRDYLCVARSPAWCPLVYVYATYVCTYVCTYVRVMQGHTYAHANGPAVGTILMHTRRPTSIATHSLTQNELATKA